MSRPLTGDESRILDEHLARLRQIRRRTQEPVPYFGVLRVRSGGRERDLFLGGRAQIDDEVALLDWQRAPLAGVFFAHHQGDEYSVDVDGRAIEGTVLQRHLVGFHGSELAQVFLPGARLRRGASGAWTADEGPPTPRLDPRGADARARSPSPVDVDLDPTQRRAVELDGARSLLILGEAGFGKTTVALHRLAHLRRRALAEGRRFKALVIVPTEGLRRLSRLLLGRLGADDVEVATFEGWVTRQARKVFPGLPARLGEDAGAAVIRLKRHPALRAVLPELAAGTASMRALKIDDPRAVPLRDLLLHLFGDRDLLERAVAASGGGLLPSAIDQALAHTRVQFSATTERAMKHVDADRLRTLDGKPIDAGTPMNDAETIDVEDFAVVFDLHRRLHGRDATGDGALSTYDHVLIDEAQELAPIELALLGRALRRGGTVTVAGDENQQIDPTAVFVGWPEVMSELGEPPHERIVLEASYRCPPAIDAAARALIGIAGQGGPIAPDDRTLLRTRVQSPCHLVAFIVDALDALLDDDRRQSVAIIVRAADVARRLHRLLRRALPVRLALGGDFDFRPGVIVTCVDEIKGLEFDGVIIPDANAQTYPDTAESRRALYVAMTRTMHQLWVLSAGRPTPLLADARWGD